MLYLDHAFWSWHHFKVHAIVKSEVPAVAHNSWKTLLNAFIIFLCSFNYNYVLDFVFLVLIPLCHSNYLKLCELDYFQWVLIREVCLLLVELLKWQYLFKCIVALETHVMVAVEHNIHLNLKFKDVIIRFLFSECSRCYYLGEQFETIIYYSTLNCARLHVYFAVVFFE